MQIGITLIGIINGAYASETFGENAVDYLRLLGVPDAVAAPLGFGAVIVVITYLSVIVGELVPKNLALRNAEGIACTVAPAMTTFAKFAAPAVSLLDASTRLVFRLFGQSTASQSRVTDEEIRTVIAEADTAGLLASGEQAMITGVIGVVQTRELLATILAGKPFEVRSHVRTAPIVPETTDALDVLSVLRDAEVPMALIHDEYGHFEGLVTPADILEAIAGVFQSDASGTEPHAVERDDGSWLLSGAMPVDEMADKIGISLPEKRAYETVAGFVLAHLQHIPKTGQYVETSGWRFEVVDLDGRRIDKVLASRVQMFRRRLS